MSTKTRIAKALREIVSAENVLTSAAECYVYSQDGTNMPEDTARADFVVFVETVEQVQAVMRLAFETKTAVVCRGAGTNLIGACIPTTGGIVLNFAKMNKILEISPENCTARVQSGVVVGELQREVEKLGLFYPPDPSNLAVSTIGGSIAQCSAGARAFKYGTTKDYVLGLRVVLADGTLLTCGTNTLKNATGYHLEQLFVGSEGTLGVVVEARLKLILKPEANSVIMAYFDDLDDAAKSVDEIIASRLVPATIDLMDKNSIQTVEKFFPTGLLCDKEAALIVEVLTDFNSLDKEVCKLVEILNKTGASAITFSKTDEEAQKIWTARRSSFGATAKLAPNVETEDIIVPRANMSKLVRGVREICDEYSLTVCIVGHVGDGNLHPQIALDLSDKTQYNRYVKAKGEIYDLAISLGGTLSGEHGIGLLKRDYLHKAVDGAAIDYMRKLKKLFDGENILNPNKIFNDK